MSVLSLQNVPEKSLQTKSNLLKTSLQKLYQKNLWFCSQEKKSFLTPRADRAQAAALFQGMLGFFGSKVSLFLGQEEPPQGPPFLLFGNYQDVFLGSGGNKKRTKFSCGPRKKSIE